MQFLASEPVSIGKILDISIRLYRVSFNKLVGLILLMTAIYVSQSLMTERLIGDPSAGGAEAHALMLSKLPMAMGYILISSLAVFVIQLAAIYRIDNIIQQREDSFIEALLFGFKKFPAMLLGVILYTLAIMGGTILLVVPGIVLTLSMMFYIYFIAVDSLGAYASLKASHNLVWGHWWRTLSVYMAPGIITTAVFFALVTLLAFLGASDSTAANLMTTVISDLALAVFMPYFFVLGYVQFHDLKLRKSGGDLALRLAK